MQDEDKDVTVLVVSCDKYSDLWPVFFELFFRYWPDCPYQLALGSNFKTFDDSRVKAIPIGEDVSWADSLKKMLTRVGSQYVLLLLDDFLLRKTVRTDEIRTRFKILHNRRGVYLRLRPAPPPDKAVPACPFGEIGFGAPYRASLQAAIWNKETLASLLHPGESPWEMELLGSRRSDSIPGFYSVWQPLIVYRHAIERGVWLRYAVRICRKEAINVDSTRRPVMSTAMALKRWIRLHCLTLPLHFLPLKSRLELTKSVQSILRKPRSN